MSVHEIAVTTIDGRQTTMAEYAGKAVLAVNVASKCGLTPQYAGLVQLQQTYADRGFTVLGFPCNQFGGQEPGSNEEIVEFCSTTYGVDFPLTDKIEVNGDGRHPLYDVLTAIEDAEGKAGDILWNFEKFLIDGDGEVVARIRPQTAPDADEVIEQLESLLS